MDITPTGFLTFAIKGQEDNYVCDLETNECNCPHWRCKVWPQVRDGLLDRNRGDCKHLRAAKVYAFNELRPKLIEAWTRKK